MLFLLQYGNFISMNYNFINYFYNIHFLLFVLFKYFCSQLTFVSPLVATSEGKEANRLATVTNLPPTRHCPPLHSLAFFTQIKMPPEAKANYCKNARPHHDLSPPSPWASVDNNVGRASRARVAPYSYSSFHR